MGKLKERPQSLFFLSLYCYFNRFAVITLYVHKDKPFVFFQDFDCLFCHVPHFLFGGHTIFVYIVKHFFDEFPCWKKKEGHSYFEVYVL